MADQIKSPITYFAILLALVFCAGFWGAWDHFFTTILFIVGLVFAWAVGSIFHLTKGILFARKSDHRRTRIAAILAPTCTATACALLALPALWSGSLLGDFARLSINSDQYEAIIAKAQANPEEAWYEEHDGVTYSVDVGPPVRVAFNPNGFLDNWSAIVYDPSGEMQLADGFDAKTGKFVAPDRITKLFGGDLVRCRSLWGDYYACSFT